LSIAAIDSDYRSDTSITGDHTPLQCFKDALSHTDDDCVVELQHVSLFSVIQYWYFVKLFLCFLMCSIYLPADSAKAFWCTVAGSCKCYRFLHYRGYAAYRARGSIPVGFNLGVYSQRGREQFLEELRVVLCTQPGFFRVWPWWPL